MLFNSPSFLPSTYCEKFISDGLKMPRVLKETESVVNVNLLNSTFWIWSFTNYKFSEYFNTQLSLFNDYVETLVKCLWLLSSNWQMVTWWLKQAKHKNSTCTRKPPPTNLEKCLMRWFSVSTHPPCLASIEKNWRHSLYSFCKKHAWTQAETPSEFSQNDTSPYLQI